MNEKLTEVTEVKVMQHRMHCPNVISCDGMLSFDGKERPIDGVHGGPVEYRHQCDKCSAGYWLRAKFPYVTYQPIKPKVIKTEIRVENEPV